jgi:aldehyde dehydrogenase (NAD+)
MASWKLGPAICCGNTVVLKPAEQTPLSILHFASLIVKAGFPPGVINIVNGDGREAGSALTSSPHVDKIAFTGSTATGKAVMRAAAGNMTPVTLETGGKSPLIVFADADLEQAAKWAHIGIMGGQGQVCTATSRIIVERSVEKRFLELFRATIESESVLGNPFSETCTQGPQISEEHRAKILQYVEKGRQAGATLFIGGSAPTTESTSGGYFVLPTVFTAVTPEMEIFQEEIFGPVAAITAFNSEEEAVALANNSDYGLGAAVFSLHVERTHRLAERLEAGMVWINSSQDGDVRAPFGGVKRSGVGRELGESALAAYTQEKAVYVNLGLRL